MFAGPAIDARNRNVDRPGPLDRQVHSRASVCGIPGLETIARRPYPAPASELVQYLRCPASTFSFEPFLQPTTKMSSVARTPSGAGEY